VGFVTAFAADDWHIRDNTPMKVFQGLRFSGCERKFSYQVVLSVSDQGYFLAVFFAFCSIVTGKR
jgi:hypothetical protein